MRSRAGAAGPTVVHAALKEAAAPAPAEAAEEAVVATAPVTAAAVDGMGGAAVSDDDAPVWPDEAAEAAFLADNKDVVAVSAAPLQKKERAAGEPEENASAPLPSLDQLVNRIPVETREVLDELFRARFVAVKRVQKSALK